MKNNIPIHSADRLGYALDLGWNLFFERVASGKIRINKESSMQLHYSTILNGLGDLMCINPKEEFHIELESSYNRKNIDITCSLNDDRGAVELKCFRKKSNRATDIDMYDVLKDVERLLSYHDFSVRRFICLTDNPYYANSNHSGKASAVSIKQGVKYKGKKLIRPSWAGQWKNKSKDHPINLDRDISINWIEKNGWYFLNLNLDKIG